MMGRMRTSRSIVLALVFSGLSSCASQSQSGLKVDLSKLRLWTPASGESHPLPPPYVADFESGPRALTLVAVDRSYDAKSADALLLRKAMAARRYSMVVVEGLPRSHGISAATALAEAGKDGADGFFRRGELSLPLTTAAGRGVPFVGAEPEDASVAAAVREAGFNDEDLFGFLVLQQLPLWRRDGVFVRDSFDDAFEAMRGPLGGRAGFAPGKEPSSAEFRRWYERRLGKAFSLRDLQPALTAPLPMGELPTQRIAAIAHRMRNEHIALVIEEMLNRHGQIFVVISSALFPVQQPALVSLLGRPVRIADQP